MNTQHGVRALIALAALSSAGCATLSTGVDPWARKAGVSSGAPVILKGNAEGMQVFLNDSNAPMKIVTVENPDFKMALGNATRQEIAQVNVNHGGSGAYTRNMKFAPAVYLNQKHAYTLRLVRADGSEARVVRTPHVGKRYVIIDWLLVAPTFGTSLLIDWTTGKWKMFDPIDLNSEFSNPARKSGGTNQ